MASVVRLNKEFKKNFFYKPNTRKYYKKTSNFWKLCKTFFTNKGFHYKQKFTLKIKRVVTSSEKAIASFLNNYFVNMAEFLNIPSWNPKNS